MSSGQTIYADFMDLAEATDRLVEQIPELVNAASEKQAEFDVARKKRELYYRDVKDRPVGMLKHLVMGDPDISALKIAADGAQALVDQNNERIMLNKKILSAMSEWARHEQWRSNAND